MLQKSSGVDEQECQARKLATISHERWTTSGDDSKSDNRSNINRGNSTIHHNTTTNNKNIINNNNSNNSDDDDETIKGI